MIVKLSKNVKGYQPSKKVNRILLWKSGMIKEKWDRSCWSFSNAHVCEVHGIRAEQGGVGHGSPTVAAANQHLGLVNHFLEVHEPLFGDARRSDLRNSETGFDIRFDLDSFLYNFTSSKINLGEINNNWPLLFSIWPFSITFDTFTNHFDIFLITVLLEQFQITPSHYILPKSISVYIFWIGLTSSHFNLHFRI